MHQFFLIPKFKETMDINHQFIAMFFSNETLFHKVSVNIRTVMKFLSEISARIRKQQKEKHSPKTQRFFVELSENYCVFLAKHAT